MELIINEHSLNIDEVQQSSIKARAILNDENKKVLIANYGNVILLPGGKVDDGETIFMAITRELKEETGQDYNSGELHYFVTLNYYQKNYPKRDGSFQNRLVKTYYFIGPYKEVKKGKLQLTEKEKKSNFSLELISLEELESIIINNENSNPRNLYFQKELLTVLANYKNVKSNIKVKKL